MDAIEAAEAIVVERYADCKVAFLAGSVIRGEATATSDLDLLVITGDEAAPYRESFRAHDWPVEAFVHTVESCLSYFATDAKRGRPSLPLMCWEGVVLRDTDGQAAKLRAEASVILDIGPPALTEQEILSRRYALTDLLDDLIGCDKIDEGMFIANDLVVQTAELILLSQRKWIGSGKWLLRAVARFDPPLAQQMTGALLRYYRDNSKDELIRLVDLALAPRGGRCFDGYRAGGKKPAEPQP